MVLSHPVCGCWEVNSLCSALLSRLRPLLYAAFPEYFECYLIFQKVDQIHRFIYTSVVNLLLFIIEYCYLIFSMTIESLYYSLFLF